MGKPDNKLVFKFVCYQKLMKIKLFKNFKNCEKGITLIELIAVIFIIGLFSAIVIADFPTIQKHFALSRASYQLAQDLRKIQDLGLSGVQINDMAGNPITSVQGYGIYIDAASAPQQYVIYADINDNNPADDQVYSGLLSFPLCSQKVNPTTDCVLDVVNIADSDPDIYIKDLNDITGFPVASSTSINFSPPNPTINIDNLCTTCPYPANTKVGIVLGLHSDNSAERTVWINTSGLISVQ